MKSMRVSFCGFVTFGRPYLSIASELVALSNVLNLLVGVAINCKVEPTSQCGIMLSWQVEGGSRGGEIAAMIALPELP